MRLVSLHGPPCDRMRFERAAEEQRPPQFAVGLVPQQVAMETRDRRAANGCRKQSNDARAWLTSPNAATWPGNSSIRCSEPIAEDRRGLSCASPQLHSTAAEKGVKLPEELGVAGAAGKVEIADDFFQQPERSLIGLRKFRTHPNNAVILPCPRRSNGHPAVISWLCDKDRDSFWTNVLRRSKMELLCLAARRCVM